MKWRSIGLVTFAVMGTATQASFDLLLLQATNIESGDLGPRVHRYDPINHVSLGSFLIGPQAVGMAASAATGELYTMDINGGFRAFSYSTGERVRVAQTTLSGITDIAVNPVDGRIFVANGTNVIYTVNRLTGAVTTVGSRAGAVYTKIGLSTLGSGNLFAFNTATNSIDRFSGSPTTYSFHSSVASGGSGTVTQLAIGTPAIGTSPTVNYARGATTGFHFTSSPDIPSSGFASTYANHADYRAVTAAHDGYYVIGNDGVSGGNTRITGVDAMGYYAVSRSVPGIVGGVRNAAIVLAPEPGSMAVLALGIGLLLRRRRR